VPLNLHSITFDCHNPGELARFWGDALGYDVTVEEFGAVAVPPDGIGSRLLFLEVPEGKSVKNRVHLDLSPSDTTRDKEVERLIALGAQEVEDFEVPFGLWTVLMDPEGNEFCIEVPVE
jgi:hypothetical protein